MDILMCMYMCVYVYMHLYMNMLLLLLYMYVCIHPFIYVPEQKIEIENRHHPQIQNSIFKIGNPKSNFRFAIEIKIKIPKLFFKNLLTKFNLYGIIYMCL